jgi:hypothetical protein
MHRIIAPDYACTRFESQNIILFSTNFKSKNIILFGWREYKIPQTRTAEISSGKQTGPVPVYFPETFAIPDNQVQARKKRNKD